MESSILDFIIEHNHGIRQQGTILKCNFFFLVFYIPLKFRLLSMSDGYSPSGGRDLGSGQIKVQVIPQVSILNHAGFFVSGVSSERQEPGHQLGLNLRGGLRS
jgi:hypothetical protein